MIEVGVFTTGCIEMRGVRVRVLERVKIRRNRGDVILLDLVVTVVVALIGSYLFTRYPPMAGILQGRGFLLNGLLLLVIVVGTGMLEHPSSWRVHLGLEAFDGRGVLCGFLLFALFTIVISVVLEPWLLASSAFLSRLGMMPSMSFYAVVRLPWVWVLLPAAEELYFRGYLQNRLQKVLRPNLGLLVATLIWAVWHVWAPQAFVGRLLQGLCVEGLLFRWRRTTWPPLIIHVSRVVARGFLG